MLINITKQQAGFGLIESLVALLVISIGLLGIAALQITSLKQNASAQWHSQAVWYSYEMTDRIVANKNAFDNYDQIDTNGDYDMNCQANPCTPAQIVTSDAQDWKRMVDNLPGGRGVIASSGPNSLTISIMWDEGLEQSNCVNGEPAASGMTCYTVTSVR